MKRFRWTRAKYRHARHLARLLSRLENMPSSAPDIVERYWALWAMYPSFGDPLRRPISWRYDPEIPF